MTEYKYMQNFSELYKANNIFIPFYKEIFVTLDYKMSIKNNVAKKIMPYKYFGKFQ